MAKINIYNIRCLGIEKVVRSVVALSGSERRRPFGLMSTLVVEGVNLFFAPCLFTTVLRELCFAIQINCFLLHVLCRTVYIKNNYNKDAIKTRFMNETISALYVHTQFTLGSVLMVVII